jgi:glycolate oxidase iron-sulfur subunit
MAGTIKDDPSQCMKCGFCMSACPIYRLDHIESHVARGRNILVQNQDKQNLLKEKIFEDALYYCLLCGRCEAVCPAGITSSAITINARRDLAAVKGQALMKRLIFRVILKNRNLMASLARAAASIPGFSSRKDGTARHFPDFVSGILHGILHGMKAPRFRVPFLSKRVDELTLPPAGVEVKGKVAVFAGCLFEFFLVDAGEKMISILAEAGYEVFFPKQQTCCGLPACASGDFNTAKEMAARNLTLLAGYDHIIVGCASCGSTLRQYGNWLKGDTKYEEAASLGNRVKDFSVFIKDHLKPKNDVPENIKVTYHDPCHLRWKQGVSAEPREILKQLQGVEYIEMEGADNCCGLGGSFGITHPEASRAIQLKKIESVIKSGADVVVTSCPGCMIQLMDGLSRCGSPIRVMHMSDIVQTRGKAGAKNTGS